MNVTGRDGADPGVGVRIRVCIHVRIRPISVQRSDLRDYGSDIKFEEMVKTRKEIFICKCLFIKRLDFVFRLILLYTL